MKTLTRQKIACYMIVLMIVLVFLLQDPLGKIKMTLVLAIYSATVAVKRVSDLATLMTECTL